MYFLDKKETKLTVIQKNNRRHSALNGHDVQQKRKSRKKQNKVRKKISPYD